MQGHRIDFLKKEYCSIIITVLCIAGITGWFIDIPRNCITYSFMHVNIFHLLVNLISLWMFKPRPLTCLVASSVAVVSSLILIPFNVPVYMGLSGFLFAATARKYVSWHLPIWRPIIMNVGFAVVNIVLNLINSDLTAMFAWQIHIVCFFLSYFFWKIYYKKRPIK